MEHAHHSAEAHAASMPILLPLFLTLSLLGLYVFAAIRQELQGRSWSRWRTMGFLGGCLLLATALSPYLVEYAHRDLRGHMIQHLLIAMFAPLGLVLGAPLTLAYRVLPRSAGVELTKLLRARPVHWISHPMAALVLNIGGMFALYVSPLYQAGAERPLLHWLVHIHFLLAGCLFVWSVAGPDPAPRRPSMRVRFFALFLSMAAHAYLSKLMYVHLWPSDTGRAAAEIQAAAKLMYYGGDLAEFLLAVAFFAVWYRQRDAPRSAWVDRSRSPSPLCV